MLKITELVDKLAKGHYLGDDAPMSEYSEFDRYDGNEDTVNLYMPKKEGAIWPLKTLD